MTLCSILMTTPEACSASGATHLMVHRMMRAHHLQVTLLGVSKDLEACGRMAAAQRLLNPRVQYACLQHAHFQPFTVATQPFEQLSHAVLQWLVQHQDDCDVVQASSSCLFF